MSLPLSPVSQFFNLKALILLILSVCVVGSAILLIYTKHDSRELHTVLQKIQQTKDTLHIEWTRLLLEQSTWASDIRVEKIAREKLDMLLPVPQQVVVIKP
jgi:cell division protein FtsL